MAFANDNILQIPTGQILFFFQFTYVERALLKLRSF